jgi:hypothetical protein
MPNADTNGRPVRGASAFEAFFLAARGRAPTAEEAKRCLAFDRLAKTSELDPATLAFIVGGIGGDGADKAGERIEIAAAGQKTFASILEQLDRIEQDAAKNQVSSPALDSSISARLERIERRGFPPVDPLPMIGAGLLAFALGVFSCSAIAYVVLDVLHYPTTLQATTFAFGLGLCASAIALGWLWLWPIIRAARRGR